MAAVTIDARRARSRASSRVLRVTLALSLLLHAAALWKLPHVRLPADELAQKPAELTVRLAPPRGAPPLQEPRRAREAPPAPRVTPAPRERVRLAPAPPAPPPAVRRETRPPVLAERAPGPAPAPEAVPAPRPPAQDLASYVESRRLARSEATASSLPREAAPAPKSAAAAEDENARANRIAAANLGVDRRPTFGPDPRKSGGIFDITHMGYDYAEFMFYGWNRDIRRDTSQVVEVRKGANPDIRIAIVRRMIVIIRDHEQGDFTWESKRLGRHVTLSARPRDNAGLEDFLMREFFSDRRP